MDGTTIVDRTRDVRRKRLLFRAWHRGIREADLIVGPFASAEIDSLDDDEIADFERLLDIPDHDLVGWIIGTEPIPETIASPLLKRIIIFHNRVAD